MFVINNNYLLRTNKDFIIIKLCFILSGGNNHEKFVCGVCGYVFEGNDAPEKCPQCGAPKEKFSLVPEGPKTYADEHQVGVAKGLDEKVVEGLRLNFTGECSEVGMYLAMSRVADRQGYPEVAEAYKRIAFEEAEHAAKFAELPRRSRNG